MGCKAKILLIVAGFLKTQGSGIIISYIPMGLTLTALVPSKVLIEPTSSGRITASNVVLPAKELKKVSATAFKFISFCSA